MRLLLVDVGWGGTAVVSKFPKAIFASTGTTKTWLVESMSLLGQLIRRQ